MSNQHFDIESVRVVKVEYVQVLDKSTTPYTMKVIKVTTFADPLGHSTRAGPPVRLTEMPSWVGK